MKSEAGSKTPLYSQFLGVKLDHLDKKRAHLTTTAVRGRMGSAAVETPFARALSVVAAISLALALEAWHPPSKLHPAWGTDLGLSLIGSATHRTPPLHARRPAAVRFGRSWSYCVCRAAAPAASCICFIILSIVKLAVACLGGNVRKVESHCPTTSCIGTKSHS